MAASEFKVGTFDKSTNTSTPVDQAVTGVGFTPKALILFATQDTAVDSITSHADFGLGFGDGTTERSVAFNDEDNLATSDTYRYGNTGKVFTITSRADGTILAVADIKTLDADGFTLTWTTNNATAYKLNYVAIGGSNVTATEVGSFSEPASTGTQNVSALADANFLMVISAHTGTEDSSVANAAFGIGFAASTSQRGVVSVIDADAFGTTDTSRWQQTNKVVNVVSLSQAEAAEADFTGFTGSGFDLNWAARSATGRKYYYLLIKGGSWQVGNGTTRITSTGTQAYTTTNKPTGVMAMTVGIASPDPPGTQNIITFGASSGAASDAGIAMNSADNVGTTDSNSESSSTYLMDVFDFTPTRVARAKLDSFNATDFTLDFNVVSGVAREFVWATMDEDLAAGGQLLSLSHIQNFNKQLIGGMRA